MLQILSNVIRVILTHLFKLGLGDMSKNSYQNFLVDLQYISWYFVFE